MTATLVIDAQRLREQAAALTHDEIWDRWCLLAYRLERAMPDRFKATYGLLCSLAKDKRGLPAEANADSWAHVGLRFLEMNNRPSELDVGGWVLAIDLMITNDVDQTEGMIDLEIATTHVPLRFTHEEHAAHCRLAECGHEARNSGRSQAWCRRCRALALHGLDTGRVQAKFGPGLS